MANEEDEFTRIDLQGDIVQRRLVRLRLVDLRHMIESDDGRAHGLGLLRVFDRQRRKRGRQIGTNSRLGRNMAAAASTAGRRLIRCGERASCLGAHSAVCRGGIRGSSDAGTRMGGMAAHRRRHPRRCPRFEGIATSRVIGVRHRVLRSNNGYWTQPAYSTKTRKSPLASLRNKHCTEQSLKSSVCAQGKNGSQNASRSPRHPEGLPGTVCVQT